MSPSYERPLLFFPASLGVSHLQAPPSIPSSVDPKARIKDSSLELLCPSAFSDPGTLLFISFETSKSLCSALLEVSPTGFGYPLGEFRPQIHGSLFQLPTLLGFPSRSFPLSQRSMKCFHPTSPLRRFPSKPLRPRTGAPAVCSRHESRTPFRSRMD